MKKIKKEKQAVSIDENKMALIKIALYVLVFVLAILFIRFVGFNNKNAQKETSTNKENEVLEWLNKVNTKFYTMNTHLTLDGDAITLNYEVADSVEVGEKTYHGITTEYVLYNGVYYKLNGTEFERLDDFTRFNYDFTFIDLEYLKSLMNIENTKRTYQSDTNNAIEYTFDLKDVLTLYNEYNDTNYLLTSSSEKIKLTVFYDSSKLNLITIDTTSLYNLINDAKESSVIYNINIENGREKDITWLIEKLN